tara:strand:- start:355 stop:522 length:168 start_codon:yes stop_codon:yes gene_type:complete
MSLKIAILTTNTPHHTYFVRELIKHYNDVTVFCETAINGVNNLSDDLFHLKRVMI